MDDLAPLFINPSVLLYLLTIIGTQLLYSGWQRKRQMGITTRRRTRGLPAESLLWRTERIAERRRHTLTQSTLLMATVVLVPFILIAGGHFLGPWLGRSPESAAAERTGLTFTLIALLTSAVISAPGAIKAFLEGLAFKTLAAFAMPFQIGDRVILQGITGKVTQLNTFFVVLETAKGEQVSLPTHSLWKEAIVAINGKDRSSLCEIVFYISSRATAQQRLAAEEIIRNTLQASVYLEPSKPIQIFLSQQNTAIQITARAHVASTYNEPILSSDITRAFLDFAYQQKIPLGGVD